MIKAKKRMAEALKKSIHRTSVIVHVSEARCVRVSKGGNKQEGQCESERFTKHAWEYNDLSPGQKMKIHIRA